MTAALAAMFVCAAEGVKGNKDRSLVYASSTTINSGATTGTGSSSSTTSKSSLTVKANYLKETITVSGDGGKKVYMSTNKGKTWELIEGTELELACYLKTADTELYFKKAGEDAYAILKLPKEEKTLTAKYVVTSTGGKLNLSVTTGVEYRKGTNGNWITYDAATFSTARYENTGFTLQFRTKATEDKRAGKIVSVKIAKKPTAPSISVDYSDLYLKGLKSGTMEYRLSTASNWTTFSVLSGQAALLDLYTVLNSANGTVDKTTTLLKEGDIEVRTKATENKLASAIRLVHIPAQQPAPTNATVKLTNDTLVISDASTKKPYEYTILAANEAFDISKVVWKKVTTTKGVSIKKFGSALTVNGSVVYVRLASHKDTATGEISVASLPMKITVTGLSNATATPTLTPAPTVTGTPTTK